MRAPSTDASDARGAAHAPAPRAPAAPAGRPRPHVPRRGATAPRLKASQRRCDMSVTRLCRDVCQARRTGARRRSGSGLPPRYAGGVRKRSSVAVGRVREHLVEASGSRAARPRPRRSRSRADARSAGRRRGRAPTPSRPPRGSPRAAPGSASTSSSDSSRRASRATCSTSSRVIAICRDPSQDLAVAQTKGPFRSPSQIQVPKGS